jgi:catechol 2,3-dioxygenase-like lactoylglutathione lyase family enzyme
MTAIVERQDRRPGVLGVHSLERFVITIPDVADAVKFYTAFGLDPRVTGNRVDLYAHGHPHCWGSLHANGQPKKLQYVSFGCYAEDYDKLAARVKQLGIGCEPHPLSDGQGIWLRDPDGTPTQIVVAPKVSPSDRSVPMPPRQVPAGVGAAPPRSKAAPVRPRRLSHMLRFTPDVGRMIQFNEDVLGMRMSDRAGDLVAFLHSLHGSDHHMIAFVKSEAPGYHHSSWDVGSVDEVGWGMETMRAAGYKNGWGVGRHVLGSNYFYYAQDPWGSFAEFSFDIDHVPVTVDWQSGDHPADDSFFYWGPDVPAYFVENTEAGRAAG